MTKQKQEIQTILTTWKFDVTVAIAWYTLLFYIPGNKLVLFQYPLVITVSVPVQEP